MFVGLLYLLTCTSMTFHVTLGMTIQGVFKSSEARNNGGQHIAQFTFYGDGYCKYDLPKVWDDGFVYFFTDKKWSIAKDMQLCQDKLSMADFSFTLSNVSGEYRFVPWEMINIWHVVYADLTTCDNSLTPLDDISFTMQLLNRDRNGQPVHHFSYHKMGLLSFYKVATFIYFITASLYGQRLWQTISKGGPMHQVTKELSISVLYHGVASLLMLTNLLWYSKDGIQNGYLEYIVLVVFSFADFKMLNLTIKVSFGWMLGTTKNKMDSSMVTKINYVVWGVTILQFALQLCECIYLLCLVKMFLTVAVVLNIKSELYDERSSLRKEFYASIMKSCCLWFLGLPFSTLIALFLPSYYRLKVITIGQRSAEIVAVFLLYKLFLSRSLYWEVSSLSSATLPLRLDKAFGKKSYATYNR